MRVGAESPSIAMNLATVAGPIFSLSDISIIGQSDICHVQLIQQYPAGLLAVSQVLVMMHPNQAKRHQCSNEGCGFFDIDVGKMPEADAICRAWFPNEERESPQWKEASISIGGAMVTAKCLQRLNKERNSSWKIAFWCRATRTWELLEVFLEADDYVHLFVHRTDFRPPPEVYESARKSITEYDLEDKAKVFLEILEAYSTSNEMNPHFSLALFVDRHKELGSHPQFIPFLPIFVGETHNVVPVGQFLRDFLLRKNRDIINSLKPHTALLERLRHMPEKTEIQEEILGFFGIVRNWQQEDLFFDYPLLNAGCGWTFFKDRPDEEILSGFPKRFLTVEPGTQGIPPFGNSASGALACAVARSLLYPEIPEGAVHYRGETFNNEKPWGERMPRNRSNGTNRSLVIERSSNGLWSVRARVLSAGRYSASWNS